MKKIAIIEGCYNCPEKQYKYSAIVCGKSGKIIKIEDPIPDCCPLEDFPARGKTIKENNLEKQHNIPINTLVEIASLGGARLYVLGFSRDCDGTPLYRLGISDNTHFIISGYSEDDLLIINDFTGQHWMHNFISRDTTTGEYIAWDETQSNEIGRYKNLGPARVALLRYASKLEKLYTDKDESGR